MSNRLAPFALALVALLATLTWTACGGGGASCTPAAETCNGLDDDCDGLVDDGFDVGAPCTAGVGACQASGVKACAGSGAATVCDAAPGAPAAEACNQVDDDCDGLIDQGLAGCCVPAATRACGVDQGACRAGLETCDGAGAWGECLLAGQPVVLPGTQAEACDGVDDDCDGQTDEAGAAGCTAFYGDQDQDGAGAGAGACLCAAGGAFTADHGGDCDDADARVHPGAVEACNGRDDDCDTQVDPGCACLDGAQQGCYAGPPGTAGVGRCAAGTQTCATGQWGACAGEQLPVLEACNGQDDDCDGATDQGDPGGGASCATGLSGACAAGALHCRSASLDCVPLTDPGAIVETCNGLDDDCDGQTDEGLPGVGQPCDGPDGDLCQEGTLACQGASGIVCGDATATNAELCNGLDDDCDGQTDEGFPQLGQGCQAGVGRCASAGAYQCDPGGLGVACGAVPGAPQAEVCNGLDDDCDGQTDEEDPQLGQACDGPDGDGCLEGAWACLGGGLQCSDTTATSEEIICNSVDDDCDGQTDEGQGGLLNLPCQVGVGACLRSGVTACYPPGGSVWCGAVAGTPSPEECNGLDDDCDGATDENPALTLCAKQTGACAGAKKTADLCQGGSWLACNDATYLAHSASYQPSELSCADGIDNDCDGLVDSADSSCP